MFARLFARLQDTHPANPRNTSNARTPFGPRNGSGILFQHLMMVSGCLGRLRKKAAHICDRANVCDGLTRHDFLYSQTSRWAAYHSNLDQLHKAKKKSAPHRVVRSGRFTHLESRYRFIRTIKPLNRHVHRRKEELGSCDQQQS